VHGANILSLDQHSTAPEDGTFLQRAIFHLPGLTAARDELERDFARTVADRFNIDYRFTEAAKPRRVAIMASKEDHCLLDLLWRNRRGELQMSVAMVIANHPDLADHVRPFGVPFIHIPPPVRSAPKPNSVSFSCSAATWIWWCWPATCRY
jgi:formyltetrahydrofolate deformylase